MTTRGQRDEIPPGMLELLIMRTLSRTGALHGFGIAEEIETLSEDVLRVEEGSLYPALQRLLVKGWIKGDWSRTEENRRARYYRVTAEGRKQVEREIQRYERISGAVARVLQPA